MSLTDFMKEMKEAWVETKASNPETEAAPPSSLADETDLRHEWIERQAYLNYERRMKDGSSGDATQDWLLAEQWWEDLHTSEPPVPGMVATES